VQDSIRSLKDVDQESLSLDDSQLPGNAAPGAPLNVSIGNQALDEAPITFTHEKAVRLLPASWAS
jgi:hypothetical protein